MQLSSSLRNRATAAALSGMLTVSVLVAVALPAQVFLALLPASGFLIASQLLFPGAACRALVFALCTFIFAIAEIWNGQSLPGAVAFACANAVEIVLACLLIRRLSSLPAAVQLPRGEGQNAKDIRLDRLTGLASRQTLVEKINAITSDGGHAAALLFIGLDNFRYVNDALGRGAGDHVLRKIAGRLRGCTRRGDVVAHLGGDEFAILLIDTHDPVAAERAAQRIAEAISAPILLDRQEIRMGASIGVASWQSDVCAADELLRRADIALNAVKDAGRGSFKFFDPSMDKILRHRQELEQDLRQAIAENAFEVHYQPIVQLATNEVIAFEALVRWRHATRGFVSPAEFIPIAEELGLIVPIGDWVFRRACKDAASWPEHIKVSVNFSRAQFECPNARVRLESALAATGLSAKRLQLEITETTIMANLDMANAFLDELRELGVEIAIDDFGTGYSSLSCLRNSSFDRLKIDRAFIRDLTTNLEARAILAMIVKLATTLGMPTTAEGVETAEQLRIVKEEGCSAMQGFFFSAAKPADEVAALFFQPQAGASGSIASA